MKAPYLRACPRPAADRLTPSAIAFLLYLYRCVFLYLLE